MLKIATVARNLGAIAEELAEIADSLPRDSSLPVACEIARLAGEAADATYHAADVARDYADLLAPRLGE